MPAYEYLCKACACRFERRQKMSDAAIDRCPECGGIVRRLISGGAGAITKGTTTASQPMCASGRPCCNQGAACSNRAS